MSSNNTSWRVVRTFTFCISQLTLLQAVRLTLNSSINTELPAWKCALWRFEISPCLNKRVLSGTFGRRAQCPQSNARNIKKQKGEEECG